MQWPAVQALIQVQQAPSRLRKQVHAWLAVVGIHLPAEHLCIVTAWVPVPVFAQKVAYVQPPHGPTVVGAQVSPSVVRVQVQAWPLVVVETHEPAEQVRVVLVRVPPEPVVAQALA